MGFFIESTKGRGGGICRQGIQCEEGGGFEFATGVRRGRTFELDAVQGDIIRLAFVEIGEDAACMQRFGIDEEPGLLGDLADGSILWCLAFVNATAGKGPSRLIAWFDEKDAIVGIGDDQLDANRRWLNDAPEQREGRWESRYQRLNSRSRVVCLR